MTYREPKRRKGEKMTDWWELCAEARRQAERESQARWHSLSCTCDICDAQAVAADAELEWRRDKS